MMILEKIIEFGYVVIVALLVMALIEHIVLSVIYSKLDI